MPLYEYKCSKCEEIFEVMQKFSDVPLKKHAGCGGKVEKLMSAPAFQLKGTGWYATDYKKQQPSKTDARTDAQSESKSEAKSESSSEAKSDGNGDKTPNAAAETKPGTKSGEKPAATAPAKNRKE